MFKAQKENEMLRKQIKELNFLLHIKNEEACKLKEDIIRLRCLSEEPTPDGCCIGPHCGGCVNGYESKRNSQFGCMLASKKKCEHFEAVSE